MTRLSAALVLLGALAAVAPVVAPAVVVRHDRGLDLTLEAAADLEFVAAVGGGSGTLIAPRWVLTAAHVVEGMSPFDFRVRFGDREVPIERTFVHPPGEPEPGYSRRTNDIALVRLAEPVDLAPASLYEASDEVSRLVTIAGVGWSGTAETGPVHTDGRRRAVRNKVLDADDRWLKLVFNRPPGGVDLEGVGGPGDSGGPMLVRTDDEFAVAGVSAWADSIDAEGGGEARYGTYEGYARVSSYLPWLRSVIAAVDRGEPVADEGPAPPGRIRSAEEGLPEDPPARHAAAFFAAWADGGFDAFERFSAEHRTRENLANNPANARARGLVELRGEIGPLRLDRYAVVSERELAVLALSDRVGEVVFSFTVEPAPPHRLAGISIAY